jgi:CRISPR-associated exonuclease Cas4
MNNYSDENLLMLSGIQHVAFCSRQWALIHIEQQWSENMLTVEGHHLHEKVDNPFLKDTYKNIVTFRSLSLVSYQLGLNGVADVVEFIQTDSSTNSIVLKGKEGYWQPIPIEYKRGKPKPDERDEVQLCAQAICLEEMYKVVINTGYLFYGETRHRHEVDFNGVLREKVVDYAKQMHQLYETGTTPLPDYKTHCKSCSLVELCMPKTFSRTGNVADYLKVIFETK